MKEKFDVQLRTTKPFTVVFPHIPKTGGTTLLYHFRKHFGDNNVLSYGPHNRIVRFFENQPQLEELGETDKDALRVIQGHGVGEGIFRLFSGEPIKLVVVLRHPVGLTRSRFSHRKNSLKSRGINFTEREFLAQSEPNFLVNYLLTKMPHFIDESAKNDLDRAKSVLRKFDYVFTTEQLDNQVNSLMNSLSLPSSLERRRVSEKKEPLSLSDKDIFALHQLDSALYEEVSSVVPDQAYQNPLGFDQEGRQLAEEKIAPEPQSDKKLIDTAYHQLAKALSHHLKAEAALEFLSQSNCDAVSNPNLLKKLIKEYWRINEPLLTKNQIDISQKYRLAKAS